MKGLSTFDLSFWSGLQGGVIGGALAAIPITAGYYRQTPLTRFEIAEIVLYAILIGASTGISAQFGMTLFRRLADAAKGPVWLFNDFSGATVFCAVGGSLLGMLGGAWFGQRLKPPIVDATLIGGSLLGSTVLTAVIIVFDSAGRLVRRILYCVIPLPLSLAFAFLAVPLGGFDLYASGIRGSLWDGARVGTIIGFVMGLQIGLGLYLHRRRTWPRDGLVVGTALPGRASSK